VKVLVTPTTGRPMVSLATRPDLSNLLGWESGPWSSLLLAFWRYVQDNGLHDPQDRLFVVLDAPLQRVFGGEQARVPINSLSERLTEMVSEGGPVVLEHRLTLAGDPVPSLVEVVVEVEDPAGAAMRAALAEGDSDAEAAAEAARIDGEMARLAHETGARARRAAFFRALADEPAAMLERVAGSLAEDLVDVRALRGSGRVRDASAEEARRARVWHEPWVEEAVMHYLGEQGVDQAPPFQPETK
jgi:hypothetical protein